MKACPACGQTLPVKTYFGLAMNPSQRRLFELVQKAGPHGITSDRLLEKLYADREDAAPEFANVSMHVRIWILNKKLKTKNKVIRARTGRGGPHPYVLRDL